MKFYRSDYLETQFIAILKRLAADDALIASYLESRRTQKNEETLSARLTTMRGECDRFETRRRALFAAYEDGALQRSDLRWRLDDLGKSQTELEGRIERLGREVAASHSSRAHFADVKTLVATASRNWPKAE